MEVEMAEPIAEVLAERLRKKKLEPPVLLCLAAVVKLVSQNQTGATVPDIALLTREHRRVSRTSWLWPCHWIPTIEGALKDPAPEGCTAILGFFQAVAVMRHLRAGRQIKKDLEALGLHEHPFTLVALAHISGRPRSLTPPPGALQASGISDVEARLAWVLWCIADYIHKELRDLFLANGIAKTCRHCDRLMVDMAHLYCSEGCRRAFQNAKDYRKRRAEKR